MANHKSALKAHRQNIKARMHNRELRTRLRHALRSARAAIESGDVEKAGAEVRATVSLIDKLAGKGIIHANTAARHKSRLSHRTSAAGSRSTASASA